jgi:GAF domain-containing protein
LTIEYATFFTALSRAEFQPGTSHQALCKLADDLIGVRLFTLTVIDNGRGVARRVFTNKADAYPVEGTKPLEDNPWSNKVLTQRQTFVANTIDAIAQVFFDHELIRSLGCEAVINIPVVVAGQVLGTINCLHSAGHYTAERVALSEGLKLPGAATFLLEHSDLIFGGA